MTKILIIEDELELAKLIIDYLKANDIDAVQVGTTTEAQVLINDHAWDLILLDIMLPGEIGVTGFDLCYTIRATSNTPIIITSALTEEPERIRGFELGADDYLTKPFSLRELVARIRAILKRSTLDDTNQDFTLIADNLSVSYLGNTIELTLIEYRLLNTLYNKREKILSRDELIKSAYDDHRVVSNRTMDSHITKLRKKLTQIGKRELIHSVYGAGYKFSFNC